ncbi:MAG: glucokinase [Chloroflexota bacterium]|jgi:glucokinase|nr:glucokinase [Chloroflexota bacterium]
MTNGRAASDRDYLCGVDVGGSTIAVLLADVDGVVAARYATATHREDPHGAAAQVAAAVRAACRAANVDPARLAGVGVGVPGRVDPRDGVVSLALNLGWHDVPLRAELEALLGVPCVVANDVRTAAAGLVERRVLGDIDDLVYLSVGTGIAAGVVLGGSVHAGAHHLAGEIGHMVIREDGPECPCGLRGCLETFAAGPGVAGRARTAIAAGQRSSLSGAADITAVDVYEAAAEGDPLGWRIADEAGRALARAIYHLALAFDVERVCLGGGVAGAGAPFIEPIERELARLRATSALAAQTLPADAVQLLPPGADAGVWGALSLARRGRTPTSVRRSSGKEVSDRSVPSPLTT